MYGAIIGDICGSIYEFHNHKTEKPEEIELINPGCYFTDDSVLTCAIADALLKDRNYHAAVHQWANAYPDAGYGGMFRHWILADNPKPYNSFGNGSAMRVSPIGWVFQTLEETLEEAKRSAEITHNHREGIKGAQAVAAAIFMARTGASKQEIKDFIIKSFDYNLNRTLDKIRPNYAFDETCQKSVPEAIIAFLESRDFTHAIQLAISIGGDTDTIACITGSIAEAFYKNIPQELIDFANQELTEKLENIVINFTAKYCQYEKILNVEKSFNPLKWLLKFKKASETKNGFSELRAEIFQETVKAVTSGGYYCDDKFICINNNGVLENTEFFESVPKLQQEHLETIQSRFSVIEAACLETAELLIKAGYNPCVLNMANRRNPGGGVLGGAGAQEENIFRRTNMFVSLYQYASYADEYGLPKSNNTYPLNRETGGVYSTGITVFRGSERNGYCYLNAPFKISIVTVPAMNRPDLEIVKGEYRIVNNLIKPTKEKMRTILRIAGKYHHDALVLGAFGCGAFKNPPRHTAELFKEVFQEKEFQNRFRLVVFAILSDHNSWKEHNPEGNVFPFLQVFDASMD